MSKPSRRPYERVSSRVLFDLSLSQRLITSVIVLSATQIGFFLIAVVALTLAASPLVLSVVIIVIAEILIYALLPRTRIACEIQASLDASWRVPTSRFEDPPSPKSVRLAREIRAGDWVCRRRDYEAEGVEYRRERGVRSGMQPQIELRMVIALLRESGNYVRLVFSDGAAEGWSTASHVYIGSDLKARERPANRPQALARNFDEVLRLLSEAPSHRRAILAAVHEKSLASYGEIESILVAQKKWGMVSDDGSGQLQLAELGTWWLRATSDGFRRYMGEINAGRPIRSGGRSVTNNNFYGPSNYVQGVNLGQMNANQFQDIDPEHLVSAIREVLQDESIPWGERELEPIRNELEEVVDEGDPGRGRQAFARLRHVLDQLAIGVGGNAAFALLQAYYANTH